MEEIVEKLSQLRGTLLLSSSGEVYVLSSFTVERDAPIEVSRGFFRRPTIEVVSYVSSITIDATQRSVIHYHYIGDRIKHTVNDLIDDRNRYLKMLRGLSDKGLTIKKKTNGTSNKIG